METSSTYPKFSFLRFIVSLLIAVSGIVSQGWGQTLQPMERVYANSQTSNNRGLCIGCGVGSTGDLAVNGNVEDHSTLALTIVLATGGTYQNLIFPPANLPGPTTGAVVKIGNGDRLLDLNLLGAITIRAYNGNTPVGSAVNAGSSILSLLANGNEAEIFLPAPGGIYDRVRVDIDGGLAAALLSTNIYHAYYLRPAATPLCNDRPVDVLKGIVGNVGSLGGVTNSLNAIDGDESTFSTLNANVGLLGAYAQQTVVFPGLSTVGDSVRLVLSTGASLVELSLLNSIAIETFNGNTSNGIVDQSNGLLDLSLLSGGSNIAVLTYAPIAPFDRVQLRLGGVASVLSSIRLHEVSRFAPTGVNAGGVPIADVRPCYGDPVTLGIANPNPQMEYAWFDVQQGGSPIAVGNTYTTPPIQTTSTYYVVAYPAGCTADDWHRTPVVIIPNEYPLITIEGPLVYTLPVGSSFELPAAIAENEDGSGVTVIWRDDTGTEVSGTVTLPATVGTYTYTAEATGASGCTYSRSITINTNEPDDCPDIFERMYATGQTITTSNLLGLVQLGSVDNPQQAVGGNIGDYSTLTEPLNALTLFGETSQTLNWGGVPITAGLPVTVKLSKDYGVASILGGLFVVGVDANGNEIGPRILAAPQIAAALNGVNIFEHTFIPRDASGTAQPYVGVKVILAAVLDALQSARIYGAYYHQDVATANCTDPDVLDVYGGYVLPISGVNAATGLTTVVDAAFAVDGNPATRTELINAVGANVLSKLEVAYSKPLLVGDTLNILLERPGTLIDVGVLTNLQIQRYLGNVAVGGPITNNPALLTLNLLGGGSGLANLEFVTDQPFDRIRIVYGGVLSGLEQLYVYEITAALKATLPGQEYDGDNDVNFIEICPGETISLGSGCQSAVIYDAEIDGNELTPAMIATWPAGTQTVYLQAVRFGCETTTGRRAVEIRVMDSSSDLLEEVTINGGTSNVLCLLADNTVALEAVLISGAPTNVTYQWSADLSGVPVELSGETGAELVLEDLVAGDYTYYVQVIADGYCTDDPQVVTFTVNREATDDDIIIMSPITQCFGQPVIISPSVSGLDNPVFTWYYDAAKIQPINDGDTRAIDGIVVTFNISVSGELTITDMPNDAEESYYVTVAGDGVCENAVGKEVTIEITSDLAAPTILDDEVVVCGVGDAVFTITNNPGGATYVIWDAVTGGAIIPQTVSQSNNTLTIVNALAGNYFIEVTTGAGCVSTIRTPITVIFDPVAQAGDVDVSGNETAVCEGTELTLTATIAETPSTSIENPIFNWYTDAALTDLVHTGATFSVIPTADMTYYVTVQGDGVCETISGDALQVDVTVNVAPEFEVTGSLSHAIEVGNTAPLPTITIPAGAPDAAIAWYDDGGTLVPGIPTATRQFDVAGIYTYTAVITTVEGCVATVSVIINVYNLGECPPVYSRVYATTTIGLGTSLVGTVQSPAQAVDADLTTFSTLVEGVNFLGLLGQTFQTVGWVQEVSAGTPISLKLGKAFTTAEVLGALRVVAVDATGNPVSTVHNVDPNLASALGGLNVFEFTFTPANSSGNLVPYHGIKVYYQAGVSLLQTARIYEVYYHEPGTVDCEDTDGIHDVITGVEPAISGLTLLTGLVGVDNEWRAVDGDEATYATLRNLVGANAYTRMEIIYNTPSLTGDRVDILVETPGTLLSVDLLQSFRIQPYLGNVAVGEPITSTSTLLTIDLLAGNAQARISYLADAPFDRIKILYGGVVDVLDELRVREITRSIPPLEVGPGGNNEFEICEREDIMLPNPDDCTSYLIYTAEAGGTIVDITTLSPDVYTLYVQAIRFGNCEIGDRTPIEVTINALPVAPVVADREVCQTAVAVDELYEVTALPGHELRYYEGETSTVPLTDIPVVNSAVSGVFTVYVSQVNVDTGCEGPRVPVIIEVVATPPPALVNLEQEFCEIDMATVADLATGGGMGVIWYGASTGGVPLDAAEPLVTGLYYASQVADGCESLSRTEVEVTVTATPPPALVNLEQEFCEIDMATVADLATGGGMGVIWYGASTGGVPLDAAEPLVTGLYYASQVADGCESLSRTEVEVTVTATPPPTIVDATPEFCEADNITLADLTVMGTDIRWYASATSTDVLPATTVLEDGITYYATQTAGNCESAGRLAVTPVITDCMSMLSITKTANQNRVKAGESIGFTLTITNEGPAAIQSGDVIKLGERPTAGLTITGYEVTSGNGTAVGAGNSAAVTTNAIIPVGGTITVNVTADVDADAPETVSNGIDVWGPDKDPETDPKDDDDDTPPIPVDRESNLSITKVANEARVKAGESTSFTLTISNNGPSTIDVDKEINLLERPGAGVTITGYEVTAGAATIVDNGNTAVLTTIGKIAVGETIVVNVTANIASDAGETITNGITIWGPDKDPETDPEDDEDDTPPIPVDRNAVLSITKSADDSRVTAGGTTSFTLTITNNGPAVVAIGDVISLRERPGIGVTITRYEVTSGNGTVDGSGNRATVTTSGAIAVGATITLKVTANIAADAGETITNGITVWGPGKDPETDDPDDEDDTPPIPVDRESVLGITKVANDDVVLTGGITTFTVTVTNNGPATIALGETVTIEERPSDGLVITGYEVTSGNSTVSGTGNRQQLTMTQEIAVGTTIALTVTADVTAPAGSTVANGIAVWGPGKNPDTDEEDDEDRTPEIPVVSPYTLSIEKVADQSLVTIGQQTSFTVTVTNNGPQGIEAGSRIALEERPGVGVTITGYDILSGAAVINGNGNSAIITTTGAVGVGATIVVRITAEVTATAVGTISNGIAVWGGNKDPDTDDPDDEDNTNPIPIDAMLVIPNLFTPNGDGLNDLFVIKHLLQYEGRELLVLNRWGNQVYKNNNYNNDWDGGTLSEGTYYYILRVRNGNGEWQTYKGAVALIRVTNR